MSKATHLDDEHMRFYVWSGTGEAAIWPAKAKRLHSWHASSGILALLASLLILNGCDGSKAPSLQQTQQPSLEHALDSLAPSEQVIPPRALDAQAPGTNGSPHTP